MRDKAAMRRALSDLCWPDLSSIQERSEAETLIISIEASEPLAKDELLRRLIEEYVSD